jgi:hypothetical protein
MDCKKTIIAIILGGLVYLVVSELFGMLTQLVLPFDWMGIGGMRSAADPLFFAMFLYGFVLSIGAAAVYQLMSLKGTITQKGIKFGALMWLIVSMPSAFVIYTTMLYPAGFYLNNLVFSFIDWVAVGIALAWVFNVRTAKQKSRKRK